MIAEYLEGFAIYPVEGPTGEDQRRAGAVDFLADLSNWLSVMIKVFKREGEPTIDMAVAHLRREDLGRERIGIVEPGAVERIFAVFADQHPYRGIEIVVAAFAFVLVPFVLLEDRVVAGTVSAMAALRAYRLLSGVAIVVLLATDIVLPVPSSLVSALAGAALGFWGGVLAIWLGMCAGCLLGYGLGRSAGRVAMLRIVGEDELERAREKLSGAGGLALLLTRGVPVLAETMVLGAGAARMPFGPFLAITGAANLAVALAYAAVGALALSTGSFFLFFLGLAVLPCLGWFAWTKARK